MARSSPPLKHADIEPLYAEVLASPDDDRPRLVLADALMERGDPRGELIAIQCARAEEDDALDRAQALLHEFEDRWTDGFGPKTLTFTFHRGFVDEVRGPSDVLARQVPKLSRLTPLRGVFVSKIVRGSELALTSALAAAGVRSFGLDVPATTAFATAFETSGLSRIIEDLSVAADGGAMLECSLPRLRALSVDSEEDEVVERLLSLTCRLEHLRVRVGDDWLKELSRLPLGERLRSLVLPYCGLAALADLNLPSLEFIDVPSRLHADEPAMSAFEKAPAPLRRISVEGTVGGRLLERLLASTPGLEALDASRCERARAVTTVQLPRLRELRVRATDVELSGLLRAPWASRLRLLDLEELGIDDAGACSIAEAELPELRTLDLRRNEVGAEGAAALAGSTTLPLLRDLDLSVNPIGESGALALANGSGLRRLVRLALHQVKVGVVAGRALKARFGNALEKNSWS